MYVLILGSDIRFKNLHYEVREGDIDGVILELTVNFRVLMFYTISLRYIDSPSTNGESCICTSYNYQDGTNITLQRVY